MKLLDVFQNGFLDELEKIKQASVAGTIGKSLAGAGGKPGVMQRIGEHLADHGHAYDLAGLGVLAVPSAVDLGHEMKNKVTGQEADFHTVGHSLAELGGLGVLAAPVAAQLALGRH